MSYGFGNWIFLRFTEIHSSKPHMVIGACDPHQISSTILFHNNLCKSGTIKNIEFQKVLYIYCCGKKIDSAPKD